jgi:hypothetical protein
MRILLLTSVAALFLATGAAHSTDEDIMLLFIAGDDGWGHVNLRPLTGYELFKCPRCVS